MTSLHTHGVWVVLVRESDDRKVIMNGIRFCSECKFDMDGEVPNDCGLGNHKWHDPDNDSADMCCECGLDVDILYK